MRRKLILVGQLLVCLAIHVVPASAQFFERIPGSLVQVAAGTYEVWGINAAQQIYRFNRNTQLFEQIPGGLVQISVGGGQFGGPGDSVWGINAAQQIYWFN